MRAKVTLHNLGGGFLSEQFKLIKEDLEKMAQEVVEETRESASGVFREVTSFTRDDAVSLAKRITGLQEDVEEVERRHIERLNVMDTKVDAVAKAVTGGTQEVLVMRGADVEVRRVNFLLSMQQANANMLEVMRQNVYLIELLRDLFDKEPRYDPRRWYDHGWR